ncbi:MAG: sulfite exporter TauE/SafE family protein, partial [Candidatus Gracilibacteria bacterium]
SKGTVSIEYEGEYPSVGKLNQIFKKLNYNFLDTPVKTTSGLDLTDYAIITSISVLIISIFFLLNKLGIANAANINSSSALPAFLVFGIMAGLSSCAALVGGLILSISKQWAELYPKESSSMQKMAPHFTFNIGRLVSYTAFGAVLGLIGGKLQLSSSFSSILVIAVSVLMVALGLQMLGVAWFQKFQISAPKFILRSIADESKFKGKYLPFLMGALTFFLPCGFTLTAQGVALISGNPIQGALIMLFFALGTLPTLLLIGFSSVKMSKEPHLSYRFAKIAGILVLFFALFNINSQMNVLGFKSFSDIGRVEPTSGRQVDNSDSVEITDGVQIIKMEASSSGYSPDYFKVKAGVPVRWEITDAGTSGCTNAVIARNLFDGEIQLTPGQTSIKEFTPKTPGTYKFSCWMGMISGIIEVTN